MAAWSRNCPPFVRMRRMMKSYTPCHEPLAHLCVLQGDLTHLCAHLSCPQGPFVSPLITAARPRFRYLWSVSAAPLQTSAPGARTTRTAQFLSALFTCHQRQTLYEHNTCYRCHSRKTFVTLVCLQCILASRPEFPGSDMFWIYCNMVKKWMQSFTKFGTITVNVHLIIDPSASQQEICSWYDP